MYVLGGVSKQTKFKKLKLEMDVYYDYEAFINLILIRNHEIYFVLRNAKKKQTGYPKNYTEGSNTLKS